MAFASAAALAVESTNIVGYVDFGGSANFNFTAITFEPITGEAFTLGDIKVNNKFDYGGDYVSIWENGYKQFEVTYLDKDLAEMFSVPEGWYPRDNFESGEFAVTDCKNAESLPPGKGFVFHRGTTGAAIILPNPLAD